MDHQATIVFWLFVLGIGAIALGPVAVQLLRVVHDRRQAARAAAERDFDEYWNTVVRDQK